MSTLAASSGGRGGWVGVEEGSGAREPGRRVGLRRALFALGASAGGVAVLAGAWAAGGGWSATVAGVALAAAALAGWTGAVVARRLAGGLARLEDALAGRGPITARSRFAELQDLSRSARARIREETAQRDRLERERADLAALLEAAGEGILLVSADGRITRANPAATRFLRLPPPADGIQIASSIRAAPIRRAIQAALDRREATAVEHELDGRRVFILAQPAKHEGAVVSLVDLTEIRRLEAARRDFVANASHELKTPLTSIRGYAETLLDESVPPDMRKRFLETIAQNATRLQRVVDDLLDLSRIEAGAWQPDPGPVAVSDIALEAWSSLERTATERDIVLEIDEDAELEVRADPFALRQIFTNLLDNALRHSADGSRLRVGATRRPRAAGDAGSAGGDVEIRVADEGAGIPTEALPRIFERFFRVDAARTGMEGGTGLGLAIVKHLVEQMGGGVRAESALGRGTTVYFSLPAASATESAIAGSGGVPRAADGAAGIQLATRPGRIPAP